MSDNTILKIIRFLANETDEKESREVQAWRDLHPEEFKEIKFIFEQTPFEQKKFNQKDRKKQVFNKIRTDLAQPRHQTKNLFNYWLKIAAIFLGLITIGISLYYYDASLIYSETNNTAQLQEISLPDGSLITLDKNASITYKNDWLNHFNRKVKLSGRAYFQITRDELHHFQVVTQKLTVEVLGTKFTVSDRYAKTQVILNEGKVRVNKNNTNATFLLSKQGEQLIISQDGKVKQDVVNNNLYFSWLKNKLNFDNCKVSETLEFLSDSYDIKLEMEDESALQKSLFGSAPSDNPQLIIEAIAKITNKKITKTDHSIILE